MEDKQTPPEDKALSGAYLPLPGWFQGVSIPKSETCHTFATPYFFLCFLVLGERSLDPLIAIKTRRP